MNIAIPTSTSVTLPLAVSDSSKKRPGDRGKLNSNECASSIAHLGSTTLFNKVTGLTLQVGIMTANTGVPSFKAKAPDEDLSPEDREAREKGLQLVTYIEQLCQTDERFQRWIQEGIDDIEAGRTVIFSEDGWKEE